MGTFIITYDTHYGRNYKSLYDAMAANHGVRLNESVWGIELDNTAAEVRDWIRSLLDDDDTIVVIQVKPKPSWGTRLASKEANDWLRVHCSS
ncbi:hypothetical protein GCM10011360_02600 [Primorskyibacter flagellatus]|uniref:Uncharacterized protein n=1 Tax=Primorskyibacter flagellatus TaxID=1387277 RepID=A0A917E9P0_9RHOB|nr:hypothetical protein GCM10011360_02600 [Primorskyibacter flagellatus]